MVLPIDNHPAKQHIRAGQVCFSEIIAAIIPYSDLHRGRRMVGTKPETLDQAVLYSGERLPPLRREPVLTREAGSLDLSPTRGLTARELIDMARAARTRATPSL